MINTFGVEEAERAGTFAKNKEQKETVFAMLALMGVPVIIKEQAQKIRAKLIKKIDIKTTRLEALNAKRMISMANLGNLEVRVDKVNVTEEAWNL